jgi:hypothetical protein
MAGFLSAPFAGFMVWRRSRPTPWASKFPARPWLLFCAGWLTILAFIPTSYSFPAGVAQAAFYITVLSPAFWAGEALGSPRQVGRVLAVLLLCNGLSATLGLGQVFYPERLNPPETMATKGAYEGEDLKIELVDGRRVFRPSGLTDSPGAAAHAGSVTALLGLCFALRPIAIWKRLGALGMSFVGIAVMYFTQVRMSMVMLVVCFAVLGLLLLSQGNLRSAMLLASGAAAMLGGALLWVGRTMGSQVFERFGTLVTSDPASLYQKSRGFYIEDAFSRVLVEYPLGFGLGWWGTAYGLFVDPNRLSPVWVEVMVPAWIYDGGFPLLIGYGGAVIVAIVCTARVALTSRDRELAFWAAVVTAQNLGIAASCFSYVTFLTALGAQFWMLAAVIHTADAMSRATSSPSPPLPRSRSRPPRVVA